MHIKAKKIFKYFLRVFLVALLIIFLAALFLYHKKPVGFTEDIKWSITFSHVFSEELGLDWKELYLVTLDELTPANLRLPVYWQEVESKEGEFDFSDYDFMMTEAEKRNMPVVLVVGERVPRWPECHTPDWAKELEVEEKDAKLLEVIEMTVKRYKDRKNLSMWQVENEPFLRYFGECEPRNPRESLDKKIALVRELDPSHKIMVTDSGELSVWLPAAKRADIFGTTMYRIVWSEHLSDYLGYIEYPLSPKFFWLKANLVRLFYEDKPIIVSELQAEPWSPGHLLINLPEEEQAKSLDIEKFYDNIRYAKEAGFSEVYLWGVEWWYWQKEENNNPEFWDAAKELLNN